MNLTYQDLQKMEYLQISESVFVFDESTLHLSHVSLRKNEQLKEIRFDVPQPNLKYLDASNCQIERVIFSQECPNLKAVYLHHNQLTSLEIVADMKALKLLDLSFNKQLTQLPLKGALPSLTYLYLHQCNLQDLSGWADYFLRDGFDFNIEENKSMVNPPAAIVSQGKDAVIAYFRKIGQEGKAYLYEAKLLILGDPRAGKTTLARKIISTSATMPTEDETTRGIELTPWNFDYPFSEKGKQNILVNIWDFGGQTIYKQTHRFFLTQRSLYVVLSDGGSSEKTDFSYWLHQTKTFGKGSPVLVFINEKEYRSYNVPMDALRKINPELKGELAVNLQDVEGADKTRFGRVIDEIQRQMAGLKHLGEPVPKGWKAIREHFLKLEKAGAKLVSWGDFKAVCAEHGEKKLKGQESLAQYFHDIGIFLHFHDDDVLRKHIFINKQWILNGAYKVVDSKEVENQQGKLTQEQFNALFSGEYDDYRSEIKALLKRFYLIYERDGYTVVPQHLSQKQPSYDWNTQENVRFNFAYKEYMPAGILWQFMVENFQSIKGDLVWRRGVVLEFGETAAEVIEEYSKDLIRIRVVGPRRVDVRAVIIANLQRINQNFDDLPVDWQVPCVCEQCADMDEPSVFDYDRIVSMQGNSRLYEWCNYLKGDVLLDKLLHGVEQVRTQEGAGKNITINVHGNGNLVAADLEHVKLDSTQSQPQNPNLATKKDIATLHARHDAHDDRLRDLMVLSMAHRDALSENARQVNDQLVQILEQSDPSEQQKALFDILVFLDDMKEGEAKAAAKKALKDDQIDMTAKLKFVTPIFVRELFGVKAELEFAVKEKVPKTWTEFKALFVKRD